MSRIPRRFRCRRVVGNRTWESLHGTPRSRAQSTVIRCAWITRWLVGAPIVAMIGCLLVNANCAGPQRLYPTRGRHLLGADCASAIVSERPRVAVRLRSGQRLEGRLRRIECQPETTIVLAFSGGRGLFQIPGQQDSTRLALHEIRSITSLEPRTNVFGVFLAGVFVGIVVLALTLAPLYGGWSG